MSLKQYKEAVKHFQASVQLKPDLITAHARLGDIYYLIGDHDRALNSWLQAKKRGLDEAYINYFIGFIYFEKKELDKASEYFAYLDDFRSEKDWQIRAKYFQALIQEKKGSREAALEILSEIKISTIGMSQIEYDILKKKIYSHFWLGLKNFYENPQRASEHFKNAKFLISVNTGRFIGNDRIVIDLLRGVLHRLKEDIEEIKKHTLSSMHFHRYSETWLDASKSDELSIDLMRVSAHVLYHCEEPILASRFFKKLAKTDRIAEMNHYVLQPKLMKQIPENGRYTIEDTLAPYISFN